MKRPTRPVEHGDSGYRVVVEIVFVVEEAPEGGYTARSVGESIFTEADTLDALRANVRSAVECHFDEGQAPKTPWSLASFSSGPPLWC
jgi:hypothetical protein